jgi:hypothetical protein
LARLPRLRFGKIGETAAQFRKINVDQPNTL